jgi:hypothetical protein
MADGPASTNHSTCQGANARHRLPHVFNVGQRTAVAGSFKLAGYEGPLMVAPVTSEDERVFLFDPKALSWGWVGGARVGRATGGRGDRRCGRWR